MEIRDSEHKNTITFIIEHNASHWRHVLSSGIFWQKIDGWYHLLVEDVGRRKHLPVVTAKSNSDLKKKSESLQDLNGKLKLCTELRNTDKFVFSKRFIGL